ncbi:MAG: hypothetical protein HZB98_07190 [Bacteroidia bacterium]|nr:hypothetical protein [Bacteroidia bacterium]
MMISVVKSFSLDRTNGDNLPGYVQLPLFATMATDYESYDINSNLIFYTNEGNLLYTDKVKPAGNSDYLPELKGHLVSGVLRDATNGKPLGKENIVLSVVGEKAKCSFTKTDEYGYFNFVINDFGTREIVIQPLSPALNNCNVELRNPFPQVLSRYMPLPFYPDSNRLAEINKAIISMQVNNIYGSYQVRPAAGPTYNDNDFYGEPDDTILINRFLELNFMKEIIKEIVPGVIIYERDDKSKFKIINGERYLISDIVLEGIIHFITKKHNLSLLGFDYPVFRQEFQALQTDYINHWPDYSDGNLKNSHVPDFRNTLYWKADIKTGDSGNATVEFYTSDEPGEYTIIVEGMTSDGRNCRAERRISVENRNKE